MAHRACFLGLVVAAMLSSSGVSHAEPPPPMSYMGVNGKVILCDTYEQIMAVANAGVENHLVSKLAEMVQITNPEGVSACRFGTIGMVAFGDSEYVGVTIDANNHPFNSWVVHVGNQFNEFYILYAERLKTQSSM
jgi:hypothetical protein